MTSKPIKCMGDFKFHWYLFWSANSNFTIFTAKKYLTKIILYTYYIYLQNTENCLTYLPGL